MSKTLSCSLLFTSLMVGCAGSNSDSTGGAVSGPMNRIRSNASANQVCAVTSNGQPTCLGYNRWGTFGDGTQTDSTTFVSVTGLSSGVKDISVGNYHTCALMNTGTVKCWGYNTYGALGNGTLDDSTGPVDVSALSDVQQIVVGEYHSCALTKAGAVYCWGSNNYGQVGNGSSTKATTATAVSGLSSGVVTLAASTGATCAALSDGSAKCWGYLGSLNWSTGSQKASTPLEIASSSVGVKKLTVGAEHICLVTTGGAAYCLGGNGFGQLGTGNDSVSATLTLVSGMSSGVAGIAAMGYATCARTTDGKVYCWGSNSRYQVGSGGGSSGKELSPVEVVGLEGTVSSIIAGYNYMIALRSDGSAVTWGSNTYGNLGTGSTRGAVDYTKSVTSATLYSWSTSGGMDD